MRHKLRLQAVLKTQLEVFFPSLFFLIFGLHDVRERECYGYLGYRNHTHLLFANVGGAKAAGFKKKMN